MTTFDVAEEVDESEQIIIIVVKLPLFNGLQHEAFRTWIAEDSNYPQIAAENGIQGRVFVQFVISSNGRVTDAEVVRGVDPSHNQEAPRIIVSSPQ